MFKKLIGLLGGTAVSGITTASDGAIKAEERKEGGFRKAFGDVDHSIFWITAVIVVVLAVLGIVVPKGFEAVLSALQGWISTSFGWFYLLLVAGLIGFSLWVAFSKFGSLKLGTQEEKPEYSTFAWVAMLFSCGIGVGFIFWGVAEPLWHYMQTPYLATPGTPEAVPVALQISLLHWGIHGWAVYVVVGLAIAYPSFRYSKPMSVGWSLYGILGERTRQSVWTKVLDIFASFATIAGISTSLGMGIISINYGIKYLLGVSPSQTGMAFILLFIIAAYILSAVSGIKRGIRWLSLINVWMAIAICAFILIFGPTRRLLDMTVNAVGSYFQNFIFMTFWTDPVKQSGWLGWWTVFYWAWWIAWGPFVGGFVARISKGRTLKEYVWGVMFIPTIFTFIWFGVIGGATLDAEMTGKAAIWQAVQADTGAGIYVLLSTLPLSRIVGFIVFVNLLLFIVTSADSASFFVAMIMQKGDLEPKLSTKLVWGVLIGVLSIVLLFSGGLNALKTASVVGALPFALVMIVMMISLVMLLVRDRRKP